VFIGVTFTLWLGGLLLGWPRIIPWTIWLTNVWLGVAVQNVRHPGDKWVLVGAIGFTIWGLVQVIRPS
jgi:hypothetical protein